MINRLLILGEQHTFSSLENKKLQQISKKINFIKYKEINSEEVIHNISNTIQEKQKILIVLNTKALVPNKLLSYLTGLEQEDIKYISIQSFMEEYLYKCYIPNELTDISFLEKVQPFTTFEYIQKRTIDYLGALILLIITSPIMLYSIYRIKKDSPGSILFKQTRIGLHSKPFTCLKFRSMYPNAEHNPYTSKNDKRIFSWGNIMRKTRIDELPQLFNVLKGDMHLIAPRAEWDILVKKYETKIPYYHKRHVVYPGITGWAQVNYPYGENSYDAKQKLMYDLYYSKNWSLWLEIKTIWRTIKVVLGKRGV